MKKILSILLAIVMIFGVLALTACGQEEEEGYEIAVVTDVGQLNDGGFNQGTYEGAKAYAEKHNKTYAYYQPANGASATDADRVEAMNNAIKNGAKVIVTPGFLQAAALKEVAPKNPDVKFIFIDGSDMGIANVVGISYLEQESGYFAGYSVVKDGYTNLAGVFGGGNAGGNPACSRFAYGYVLGAKAAAKEMGVEITAHISFKYGATFSASSDLQAQALGLYNQGTQVIFACGGSMVNSVIAAADENGGNCKIVGVDTDQKDLSSRVITSAVKGLAPSVEWALDKMYGGQWDSLNGGAQLGAADDATGLPTAEWRFSTFTKAEYETLFNKVKSGSITITAPADFTLASYTSLSEAGVITVTAEE